MELKFPSRQDARRRASHTYVPSKLQSTHEVSQPPIPSRQLFSGPEEGWKLREKELGGKDVEGCSPEAY